MIERYERPATVAEAAALLAGGSYALLAGGTDLYPAHVGKPIARPLLDLSRVAGLRAIGRAGEAWVIGALATWTDVLRAPLPPLFDGLKAAAREVGGVQIQNSGTVVGNVCNASPAADGVPALLALDAEVVLASARGERLVPLAQFISGPRLTALRADELVTSLRVPARDGPARSVFLKLGGRRYLVISVAMVAAVIEADGAGIVTHAAIAIGSCAPVAMRLTAFEARLVGTPLAGGADLVTAADLASLRPIDDIRASAVYRADAALTLVRRALASLALPT